MKQIEKDRKTKSREKTERENVFRSWKRPKAWLIVQEHVGLVYNSVL